MRDAIMDVLAAGGLLCLVAAAFLLNPIFGLAVAGVVMLGLSVVLGLIGGKP